MKTVRLAIAYLTINWRGGIGRVLDCILARLKARHEVALFTLNYLPMQYKTLDSLERHEFLRLDDVLGHFKMYLQRKAFLELAKALKQWSPDVILFNTDLGKYFHYAGWIGFSTKIPVVLYQHGSQTLPPLKRPERLRNPVSTLYRQLTDPNNLLRQYRGLPDLIICVSRSTERAVQTQFPETRTMVIYNGVDHEWFYPTWEDEGYALCTSRFSPEKNQELLLKAFGSYKYPIKLCGSIGKGVEGEEYFVRLKSTNIGMNASNVEFRTNVDEYGLRGLLQKCRLFLHPGRDEGFGLAPLEAMACGKVVLAHNSGATPECVDGAGFLLGDDAKDWRGKVDELWGDDSLRNELGRKAYEYSKQFTWDKTASGVEEALESAVNR